MERIILDCDAITTKEAVHAALSQALGFPAWYGGNLDALHDLLTDIATDTILQLHSWADMEAALGPYGKRLKKVLAISAQENPYITIEFC